MPLVNWIKAHKLASLIILIVAFFLLNYTFSLTSLRETSVTTSPEVGLYETPTTTSKTADTSKRVVVKNSNLSLLVRDVAGTNDKIVSYAKNAGGYMVSTSFTRSDESPYATVIVRVPTSKLDAGLKYFRSLAIKVTSENLVGTDVTDQYTDIKTGLAILKKTKAKFEEILEKATKVQDILTVQEKIISVQSSIDALKGQQKAIEQNAALTKITLYLSTDELALPYTPDEAFRPNIVFRQAIRSLLGNLRDVGELLIWIGVYSIIWVPALIIFFVYRRWRRRRNPPTPAG